MMKKQAGSKFDPNGNAPTGSANASGFFTSEILPLYFQPEWNAHDFAYIHSYAAINKDNYVALSGDVYWDGYGNTNPIRISTSPIDQLYKNAATHVSNTIVNKQFWVNSYNVAGLDGKVIANQSKTIDHSNYITTKC